MRQSYHQNAKEAERDILICDEFGYDDSKDLPFGWYTLHQTKAGVPGTEFVKDIDIYISQDGQVYRYLLNNAQFESRVMVVKKDNTREMYDRAKIEAGILHSCHKRPVSQGQISALIDDVENNLFNREEREISTAVIGELVMERLKDLDVVTYVRFASVYREFKDVDTFMEELQKIQQRNVPSYESGKNGEETR